MQLSSAAMPTPAENFLLAFHARFAGATSIAFGNMPVHVGGDTFASSYEVLAAQVPRDAAHILDLACGDGWLLALLARTHPGATLAGVDMSPAELAAAAARLKGRASLHECRAQQLPFADAAFDAVTCHMALMLMDDAAGVLVELRRVLRAGGTLAAVVGAGFVASPVADLYRTLLQPQLASASTFTPLGDRSWRTAEGVHALLGQAGFAEVSDALIEGELRRTPEGLWDYFTRMYDLHFLDDAVVADLRERFIAGAATLAAADGTVPLAIAWRRVRASSP